MSHVLKESSYSLGVGSDIVRNARISYNLRIYEYSKHVQDLGIFSSIAFYGSLHI